MDSVMGSGVEIMTWYTSVLQTDGLLPTIVWSLVRWIVFFFKLASLSFAVPVFSFIAFDLVLWLWRLTRTVPSSAHSQPSFTQADEQKQSAHVAMSTGSSSAPVTGHSQSFAGMKRAGFPATDT